MEWLVQGLENSDQAKLPMWMIITEIYWKDLLRFRKYGRRLVATLVRHYHEVRLKPFPYRCYSVLEAHAYKPIDP
jgi:mediator of RNA polymerase II transcription subunit 12, fungi type